VGQVVNLRPIVNRPGERSSPCSPGDLTWAGCGLPPYGTGWRPAAPGWRAPGD